MVLFWVYDYIFYTENEESKDEKILSMKYEFQLEREEDLAGLLGI